MCILSSPPDHLAEACESAKDAFAKEIVASRPYIQPLSKATLAAPGTLASKATLHSMTSFERAWLLISLPTPERKALVLDLL